MTVASLSATRIVTSLQTASGFEAHAQVKQPAVMSQGDLAAGIELVGAHAVVRPGTAALWSGLGYGRVSLVRGKSIQRAVGSFGVVRPSEELQIGVEFLQRLGRFSGGQPSLSKSRGRASIGGLNPPSRDSL